MLTIRAMSDGRGYASRHLENSDYYAEGERIVGRWQGRGAELLGLHGEVQSHEFEAVRQGLEPRSGEFLRQRHSADRTGSNGEQISRGRSLYDLTFSAPKSVSVMAIAGRDERLAAAHQNAVTEALAEVETYAASRVRRQAANGDRTTGSLVLAVYHHDASRELDPQLHTHAVAANLTYDGAEGTWKALQASGIYERRSYLTEIYRNALAREVVSLGYEIRRSNDPKGRDCGFEIAGVPDALLTKYSQRSQQRDEAIARFRLEHGREPGNNEVAVLVRESRAKKLVEISTEEVRARQLARLTRQEAACLARLRRTERTLPVASAAPAMDYAQEHVFERVSVARDYEVLAEALRHGRGQISSTELKALLAIQESTGRVIRQHTEIATAESLAREREMIAAVNRGIGCLAPLGNSVESGTRDRLRPEQRNAVEFVLKSRDRFVGISGAAGTGKTAILEEVKRQLEDAGRSALAIAPTMAAVEELQKVGFSSAVTVERLLQDRELQAGLEGSVLILDEAGMVSGRQMSEIVQLAETRSARVVFSGDTKQIQSVEAGDALRILEQESQLKSVALTQVQRQTRREYRNAVEQLRIDPALGIARLDAMGAVREVGSSERAEEIAKAYASACEHGALVVCATHEEIERVTEAIRTARKRSGQLGDSASLIRYKSLNWTTAQKRQASNFQIGQKLLFHRGVKGIDKNEAVEVVRIDRARLIVRTEAGEERAITGKQARSFDVVEQSPIEVAPGDRLLLTANRRGSVRTTNGELVTVSRVDQSGNIDLEDGRRLPRIFRDFMHGYAVTAHRSQGKSVDSVIVSADGMRKELFYVAATRGRANVLIVTSDKERLCQTVAKSTARKSACELARNIRPRLSQSLHRGITAARELVRRVTSFVRSAPRAIVNAPVRNRTYEHDFSR